MSKMQQNNAQTIQRNYEDAKRFLAVLNTQFGAKIRVEHPHLVTLAEQIVLKYENEYIELISKERQDVEEYRRDIEEAKDALTVISETNHDAIKQLQEIIDTSSRKLQDTVLFNPDLFFDQYYLSLFSPMTNEVNKSIKDDPRFKLWFEGSKCVDDNGNPLLLYHGTGGVKVNEFDEFSFTKFPGAYFAENKSYADWFSQYRGGKSLMYKVHLRVTNPIDLTPLKLDKVTYHDFLLYIKLKYGYDLPQNKMLKALSDQKGGMWAWQYLRTGVDWLKHIKNFNEFDGFIYYENNPDDQTPADGENVTKAWLVLSPNQIKSADTRNTIFSLESNNMKMQRGGAVC